MQNRALDIQKVGPFRYRISRQGQSDMNTDGLMFLNEALYDKMEADQAPLQVANVATLPGIVGQSLAMPDMHWGYGFPIGGVAAFDLERGVISPGGVGYDINCGVNLTRTSLRWDEIKTKIPSLIDHLFSAIPTGVGSHGALSITKKDFEQILVQGARWAVAAGITREQDRLHMEEDGCLNGANPDEVSDRARERGFNQIGTLGSGNHFVEIQVVEKIFDLPAASSFGLFEGQLCFMVHSGSRGFGYQVCTDFLPVMNRAADHYGIPLPDRQLACAPLSSKEGQAYFAAMKCAANYAWVNRLTMCHHTRAVISKLLGISEDRCGFGLVYDVSHNIAKYEDHLVNGKMQRVCVHRKGATRSLPAEHPLLPLAYRHAGQPVLIPGDMGRASYVLVGEQSALTESFGSAPHGAGRLLSRHQGAKLMRGDQVREKLASQGIFVQARSRATLAEEQPEVYKDVEDVVQVAVGAGLARAVARLKPVGAIKG
jgi:tRNA-splicing ligase RtcB